MIDKAIELRTQRGTRSVFYHVLNDLVDKINVFKERMNIEEQKKDCSHCSSEEKKSKTSKKLSVVRNRPSRVKIVKTKMRTNSIHNIMISSKKMQTPGSRIQPPFSPAVRLSIKRKGSLANSIKRQDRKSIAQLSNEIDPSVTQRKEMKKRINTAIKKTMRVMMGRRKKIVITPNQSLRYNERVLGKPAARYKMKQKLNNSETVFRKEGIEESTKHKRRKNLSFDKKRLALLSQPKRMFTRSRKSSNTSPKFSLAMTPNYLKNLRCSFKLPNKFSKLANLKYCETLANIGKANIYGIKLDELPSLQTQFTKYQDLLSEKERLKLKRTFAGNDA
ncbi:unnamed protein product [Moneuplotes crassus]|uniref:Uncharacterized protein n=2 Tax=Euplotes crassus TaxID=5936 RepID=A0AAD1USJ5_EUPCR|nr:unnamed protein product [Moneuplotes crassus]